MKNLLEVEVKLSDFDQNSEGVDYDSFTLLAAKKVNKKRSATEAFGLFDVDGKGVVVLQDLQRVASELGESFELAELEEMVNEVDRSGDGLLTQEDFLRIVAKAGV